MLVVATRVTVKDAGAYFTKVRALDEGGAQSAETVIRHAVHNQNVSHRSPLSNPVDTANPITSRELIKRAMSR